MRTIPVFIYLSGLMDYASTIISLNAGNIELNPLVQLSIETGLFLPLKMGTVYFAAAAVYHGKNVAPRLTTIGGLILITVFSLAAYLNLSIAL